ncbi:GTP-dependent dephospho-CoA kinase family protein [Halorarius halobius]|uniref:GTP-dependent dephospho-CoA kinase family protein n=1 Tax=Halorarius halobius TaxID=2962671 RepID=UPI0020CCAD04|nr:DUF359 domain-containing protein [Halorarius halobius]
MAVVLELPRALRAELKEPLGPVYTDADALLAEAGEPVVCVGDVVTYHLLEAGRHPDVALVDGKTKREQVDQRVRDAIEGFDRRVQVENPAGALTAELLETLAAAIGAESATLVEVVGEEDLAALPAVLAAPDGASVVYGQPDEGMVLATVDDDARRAVRELLDAFDGDHGAAYAALGVEA